MAIPASAATSCYPKDGSRHVGAQTPDDHRLTLESLAGELIKLPVGIHQLVRVLKVGELFD